MAGKNYTVVSPVRYKGTLYGEGQAITIEDKDLEPIMHCVRAKRDAEPPKEGAGEAGAKGEGEGEGGDPAGAGAKAEAASKGGKTAK